MAVGEQLADLFEQALLLLTSRSAITLSGEQAGDKGHDREMCNRRNIALRKFFAVYPLY
jgi:hypothetical protein